MNPALVQMSYMVLSFELDLFIDSRNVDVEFNYDTSILTDSVSF